METVARRTEHAAARTRLGIALVAALVLHLALLPVLQWVVMREAEESTTRGTPQRPTAVRMLTEADVARMFAQKKTPQTRAARNKPKPKPKPKPPAIKRQRLDGQVVRIPPPKNDAAPEDARYLAEFNSTVERESVRRSDKPPQPEMRKSDRSVISSGDDISGNTRDADEVARKREAGAGAPDTDIGMARRPTPEVGEIEAPRQEDVQQRLSLMTPEEKRLRLDPAGIYRAPRKRDGSVLPRPGGEGPGGGSEAPADYRSLLPTLGPEDLRASVGTTDHLPDIAEGEGTFLNAREYKYAWFFNRVKSSVEQYWNPVDEFRRRDPYGRVHGVRDRFTVVHVTLDQRGYLEDAFVKRDSGLMFLDEEALDAFRAAQPFPNPPDALRDEDGRVRFTLGFYVDVQRGGLRIFRR
jgi:TonB family protein